VARDFSLLKKCLGGPGAHPPGVLPWGQSSQVIKGDHSSPSRADVKNEWRWNSAAPVRLHGMDRDIFTVTLHNKEISP